MKGTGTLNEFSVFLPLVSVFIPAKIKEHSGSDYPCSAIPIFFQLGLLVVA